MTKVRLPLLCGAGLLALMTSVSARAQDANTTPKGAVSARTGLDEIVVTARRREESLQAVPIAVQAFDGATLTERRIENATDLSKIVPALTSAQSSRDEENYVIRAQSGSGASISGQQVTVPAYMAQVPLPIGDGGGPGRYYDLQNVQVLKGPQGTLFGRNSTGGAILFEPRRPGSAFGGYLAVDVGNYNKRGLEGAINLPVAQKLMVRVAGKWEERDGFTVNKTTGQDQDNRNYWSARASILWQPSDAFENILVADYLRSTTNGSSNHLTAVDPNATIPRLFAGAVQAQLARQNVLGPYVAISSVPGRDAIRSWGFSNITTVHPVDGLTIKNIVGLRRIKQLNRFDYDGTPLTLLDFDICATPASCHPANPAEPWSLNVEQWSEEFQVQGTAFDVLTYTVGVFGSNTTTPAANYIHQTSVFGSTTDVNQWVRDRSRAVYAQLSYDLSALVKGLTATAGYRRTHDERGLTLIQVASGRCTTGATGTVVADPGNAPQCSAKFNTSFNTDSYTLGFDWKITDSILTYIAARRGYRAGGLNPLAAPVLLANPPIPNAQSLFTYQPEFLNDVEIGLKADWNLGGNWRLRTNIAAYSDKLTGAQLNQTFSVGTSTVSALVNAASARIKGIEAEAVLRPDPHLSLSAAYAYTEATYGAFLDYNRRDPGTNAPGLFTGRIFPFTPRHKLNIGGTYTLPVGDKRGDISLSANWAYKSSITLGLVPFINVNGVAVPDGESVQKETGTVDVNLAWKRMLGSPIDASLFVTNLFDVTYKIGGASLINSGLGINQRIYNEPRMIGLHLRFRFGDNG